ncbi:MAG: hypothetical protein KF881_14055 [Acidobacteria bacterium]|nr:hypothetical protein [Acidobacteriota bacterium]
MRGIETSAAEFDALGQSIGIENPYPSMTPGGGEGCIGCGSSGIFGIDDNSTIYVNGQRLSMTLDGARISYSSGMSLLYVGASAVCPNNDCGPRRTANGWERWDSWADGFEGYIPIGAYYSGDGSWSWMSERERRLQALSSFTIYFFAGTQSDATEPCEIITADGSKIAGIRDSNGVCRAIDIGEFSVQVVNIDIPTIDNRSFVTGNKFGKWVDFGRLPQPSASEIQIAIRNLNQANSNCGTLGSALQHGNVSGEFWRGTNKWNYGLSGRGPNQYTGPRSIVIKRAEFGNTLARRLFYVGVAITGLGLVTGTTPPEEAMVDTTMAVIGVRGGAPGALAAGGYFGYQFSSSIPRPYERSLSTSSCHSPSGLRYGIR